MCLSDLDNNYPKIDIKRERNQKSLVKDQTFEVMLAQHNGSDKSSCDACREKKLQVNTALGEKSVIALSSLFTKDLLDKQKSWSLGGKIQTEPENKVTLCKVHAKSPKCDGVGLPTEEKQLSETSVSLSDEKQWHDINVYLGLSSCSKQPDRLDGDGHDRTGTSEVSCCTPNVVCIGDNDLSESKCCHPSNIIIEAPGHMTDTEWMNIFKPSRAQRIVRHKTMCTCSRSVSAMKYNSSARLVMFTSVNRGADTAARTGGCSRHPCLWPARKHGQLHLTSDKPFPQRIDTGVFVQGDITDSSGELSLRAASKAEVLLKSKTSYEQGKDVLLENKQVGHCAEWNAVLGHSSRQHASQLTAAPVRPRLQYRPQVTVSSITPHGPCTAPLRPAHTCFQFFITQAFLVSKYDVKDRTFVFNKLIKVTGFFFPQTISIC